MVEFEEVCSNSDKAPQILRIKHVYGLNVGRVNIYVYTKVVKQQRRLRDTFLSVVTCKTTRT